MTLVIDGLRKRFGDIVALDGVGFSVGSGQVFGFLGPNGAGKTTTMRIVLDILHPDEGTVTWNGVNVAAVPRRTWGYLPEERGLYPRMGVLEQLVFVASLYGVRRDEAARRRAVVARRASGSRTTRIGPPSSSARATSRRCSSSPRSSTTPTSFPGRAVHRPRSDQRGARAGRIPRVA